MPRRRTPITIELDERERSLRYDLNALCLFEEETKTTLSNALRNLSMPSLRALLWVGLIHEDAMLTVEDVGKMEFSNLQEIIQKVVAALGADGQQTSPARPTEAPAVITESTGTNSGASDDTILVSATANSGD